MTELFRTVALKLMRITAKNKVSFYALAAILIPLGAVVTLCSEHVPELVLQIRTGFAKIEEDRQYVLSHPEAT